MRVLPLATMWLSSLFFTGSAFVQAKAAGHREAVGVFGTIGVLTFFGGVVVLAFWLATKTAREE